MLIPLKKMNTNTNMNIFNILNKIKKRKEVNHNIFQKNLLVTDVQMFREALQTSKSEKFSNYSRLQEVYTEVVRDIEVSSSINLLKNNILSRKKNINDKVVNDIINIIFESKLYGYSLLAIDEIDNNNIKSITSYDRTLYNPKNNIILNNRYTHDGVEVINEYENWYIPIICKENESEGLLANISIYQIYLKQLTISWLNLINRFGTPQPILKTSNNNEDYLREMEEYLSNIQNGTFAILDQETNFEMIATQALSSDVYELLKNHLQGQIRKALLGTESLGSEKSFVGSAEIAYDLYHNNIIYYINYIEEIFNNLIIPKLKKLGIIYDNLEIDKSKFSSKEQTLQTVSTLLSAGCVINKEWLENEFNVKIDAVSRGY